MPLGAWPLEDIIRSGSSGPAENSLAGHEIATAYELGWSALKNGELIAVAEANGYSVLVTTDQNLKYQQNLSGRKISIVVLLSTSWPRIQRHIPSIAEAIARAASGSYEEVPIG